MLALVLVLVIVIGHSHPTAADASMAATYMVVETVVFALEQPLSFGHIDQETEKILEGMLAGTLVDILVGMLEGWALHEVSIPADQMIIVHLGQEHLW